MYAKIFSQIFDSSIADDYELRHFFMDLLVLADADGVVDMTENSIAARTRIPIEKVKKHLVTLCDADERSRTPTDDGRRLKLIDEHRNWGWFIINYDKFREIASDMQRRERTRLRTQKYREKLRCDAPVTHSNTPVTPLYASASASVSDIGRGVEKPTYGIDPKVLEMKTRIYVLFKKHPDDPWSYEEQNYTAEVCRRPRCMEEMAEIEAFWKFGTYRPQKSLNLLKDWQGMLDRVRTYDENQHRNKNDGKPKSKCSIDDAVDALIRKGQNL